MKRWISILTACLLAVAVLPFAARAEEASGFSDLAQSAWYALCVEDVQDRGLMNGTGNGRFDPDGTLTRAMLVTTLWRMAKSPASQGENPFTDVENGTWYADAVTWAAENAVVLGIGNDRFAPTDPVTREQMAVIFFRWAEKNGVDAAVPSDGYADDVSDWAAEAVLWAEGQALLPGRPIREPGAPTHVRVREARADASRAEVEVFLSRYCQSFLDEPDGREPALVTSSGIVTPDETLTRTNRLTAEAARNTISSSLLSWKFRTEDEPFRAEGLDRTKLINPVYDGQGRLTRWSAEGEVSMVTYSVTYSPAGDPVRLSVRDLTGASGSFALYYKNVEGHSVLIGVGVDGDSLTRVYPDRVPLAVSMEYEEVTNQDTAQTDGYTLSFRVHSPRLANPAEGWQFFNDLWLARKADIPNRLRALWPEPLAAGGNAYGVDYGDVWWNDGSLLSVSATFTAYFEPEGSSSEDRLEYDQGEGMTWLVRDLPEMGLHAGERLDLCQLFGTTWEKLSPVLAELTERPAAEVARLDQKDFVLIDTGDVKGIFVPGGSSVSIPLAQLAERGFHLITE